MRTCRFQCQIMIACTPVRLGPCACCACRACHNKEELSPITDSGVITSAMSCISCSASISLVPCALLHWCLPSRAVCASLHPFRPASHPLPHGYHTRDSMPILCIALCSIDCRCQISHDNSSHSSFAPVCPTFHAYLTTKEVKCMCAHNP